MATMKQWMQNHNGQEISTLQSNNDGSNAWMPGYRTVDTSRASYVSLGDSRRDYAGMRVVAVTDDVLTVADDWQTITYWTRNADRSEIVNQSSAHGARISDVVLNHVESGKSL